MLRVTVPATSANLGPGFDTLGLAVGIHLVVTAEPATVDEFVYSGSGAAAGESTPPAAAGNLVHGGFKAVHESLGLNAPAVRLCVDNEIPLARGLGSSSAALVAGAALADAWLGEPLGRDGVFRLTAELEGHPDNVGPAVYGGFTVAARGSDGGVAVAALPLPPTWRLLFAVPVFELPTATARTALPERFALTDVVATSSRTALWVAAVALDTPHLLATASLDVLHQPYRAALVPGLADTIDGLRDAGAYAAFLSGAGPTVGAVVDEARVAACSAVMQAFVGPAGTVLAPSSAAGYRVERW